MIQKKYFNWNNNDVCNAALAKLSKCSGRLIARKVPNKNDRGPRRKHP